MFGGVGKPKVRTTGGVNIEIRTPDGSLVDSTQVVGSAQIDIDGPAGNTDEGEFVGVDLEAGLHTCAVSIPTGSGWTLNAGGGTSLSLRCLVKADSVTRVETIWVADTCSATELPGDLVVDVTIGDPALAFADVTVEAFVADSEASTPIVSAVTDASGSLTFLAVDPGGLLRPLEPYRLWRTTRTVRLCGWRGTCRIGVAPCPSLVGPSLVGPAVTTKASASSNWSSFSGCSRS